MKLFRFCEQERALVKSNADLTHVEHEKESLSAEVAGRRQELEQSKRLLDSQRAEEAKLRRIISEASAERARQKKELEKVITHNMHCVHHHLFKRDPKFIHIQNV